MNCLYEDTEGNEFTIHFAYQPEEKPVFDPNNHAHPGCAEEVYVWSIIAECDGSDVIDNINEMGIVDIEEACLAAVDDIKERLECERDDAADARYEERRLGHE